MKRENLENILQKIKNAPVSESGRINSKIFPRETANNCCKSKIDVIFIYLYIYILYNHSKKKRPSGLCVLKHQVIKSANTILIKTWIYND